MSRSDELRGPEAFHSHFDLLKGESLDPISSGEHESLLFREKKVVSDLTISTIPSTSQLEITTPAA